MAVSVGQGRRGTGQTPPSTSLGLGGGSPVAHTSRLFLAVPQSQWIINLGRSFGSKSRSTDCARILTACFTSLGGGRRRHGRTMVLRVTWWSGMGLLHVWLRGVGLENG